MADITWIREAAGCTSVCSLSATYRVYALGMRFTHNGVRFSHAVDVDHALLKAMPDIEELLAYWCREHHAGRSGNEITFERNGETITVLIPEAVI